MGGGLPPLFVWSAIVEGFMLFFICTLKLLEENSGTVNRLCVFFLSYLPATRGARNPNLQVVITHAWHVCNQHSFGLPLRTNGLDRTQFDHARLEILSLVI